MRKITQYTSKNQTKTGKLFFNSDWDEFVVQLWINGVHQAGADYHTDDRQDAKDTMKHMVDN